MERFKLDDLVLRAKESSVSRAEISEVAQILERGHGGADTYALLYVLARSQARQYEELISKHLNYRDDPMVARVALQALVSFWGLVGKYRDVVLQFLRGVAWDDFGDVRQIAISAAGEYLAANKDCDLLRELLRLSADDEDEVEQRIALEALGRSLGDPVGETLKAGGDNRQAWMDDVRARALAKQNRECR